MVFLSTTQESEEEMPGRVKTGEKRSKRSSFSALVHTGGVLFFATHVPPAAPTRAAHSRVSFSLVGLSTANTVRIEKIGVE